jgi:taspase (threonine aspartase 1)
VTRFYAGCVDKFTNVKSVWIPGGLSAGHRRFISQVGTIHHCSPVFGACALTLSLSPRTKPIFQCPHTSSSAMASFSSSPRSSPIAFVAVHAGAGIISQQTAEKLKHLFDAACRAAFSQCSTVEEAVKTAISVLEASPLTNSGFGSCLTEQGVVECEAGIMLGNGSFGSVSAASGVDSAIGVAFHLVKERDCKGLVQELGRIRPIMMVGEGVYRYAVEHGLPVVARELIHDHNVTERTRSLWRKYKTIIFDASRAHQHKKPAPTPATTPSVVKFEVDGQAEDTDSEEETFSFEELQHGTVGAIACDFTGQVCAGVSSGGIWMKQGGRVGSSALIGCGCYAENGVSNDRDGTDDPTDVISAACCISGCGEDIIEECMALRCCDELKRPTPVGTTTPLDAIMRRLLVKKEQRLPAPIQSRKRSRNAMGSMDTQINDDVRFTGIIALRVLTAANSALKIDDGAGERLQLEFCFAHTSKHFALAHASRRSTRDTELVCEAWVNTQSDTNMKEQAIEIGIERLVL